MTSGSTADELLHVAGLTKIYRSGSTDFTAVGGVDLRVRRGEVVGLLGANGAGKTTTIKCITGLVTPTAGTITIGGIDARCHRRETAALMSALLEGNRNVYWRLDPRENLDYFAALRGIRRADIAAAADEILERFDLAGKVGTPVMKLSRGMQQKLSLACCVATGTPLLLLDEPTLGLDVETSRQFRGYLRELVADGQRGLLITSHDMKVIADVCDRVIILKQGRVIIDDRVDSLLALFRVRTLAVVLDEPLLRGGLDQIRQRVDVVEAADPLNFTVTLADADQFYVLVDALRSAGAFVRSIDQIEPDLEEVFLTVTREAAS